MQFKYPLSQTLSNFYENYLLAGILGALLATTLLFSNLIPPFQSPDEFEHIKRAYLLSTGDIVLKTYGAESSGGQINVGLLSYIKHFQLENYFQFNSNVDQCKYLPNKKVSI